MALRYNLKWVQELNEEMQKTGVISQEFKHRIIDLAHASYQEGFEDGELSIKNKETLDQRLKRKKTKVW